MHKKHQCLKCYFENVCDGQRLRFIKKTPKIHQRECEIMETEQYKKLMDSQKSALQTKVEAAIKQAVDHIKMKQNCLSEFIESHPRINWKFEFEGINIDSFVEENVEFQEEQIQPNQESVLNRSDNKEGNSHLILTDLSEDLPSLESRLNNMSSDQLQLQLTTSKRNLSSALEELAQNIQKYANK